MGIMMLESVRHIRSMGASKMISSIKLFSIVVALISVTSACAEATHFEPGVYENLLLAVNKDGDVTGYYREEQGEGVVKSCAFSLQGAAKEGVAKIVAWGDKPFTGELKAEADAINLKIEKGREIPGCGLVLMPEIASGLSFDLVAKAPWSELRAIANEKSYFYSEPSAAKLLKSYLVKGDVVGVVASQGEWLQIDYYSSSGKMSRRWIYARDTASFQPVH